MGRTGLLARLLTQNINGCKDSYGNKNQQKQDNGRAFLAQPFVATSDSEGTQ
jgi:hypothetical protein